MKGQLFNWVIGHNGNPAVVLALTLLFPERFLGRFYRWSSQLRGGLGGKANLTISFDCDYPEDVKAIPNVLALFRHRPFRASFAAVGHWIERYPEEHRMVVEEGHEIVNHTFSHPDNELLNPGRRFSQISREEKKEEITRCHEVCQKFLGYSPVGVRIPHFKRLFTPEIYGILRELGYRYSSSTWATGTSTGGFPFRTVEGIWEFPLSTCPKHPFTVFDTWHSLNTPRLFHRLVHRGPEEYCSLFRKLVDMGVEAGCYLNIYIDPADVLRVPAFPSLLDGLESLEDKLTVVTYTRMMELLGDGGLGASPSSGAVC